MRGIFVIGRNTLRENLRDKILYNLVLFALVLMGVSLLLGTLTIAEQEKIAKDVGLAAINLVGVLIAIFIGIGLVTKEIDRRTIYTLLAKPITRTQFLLGKYFGLAATIGINVVFMLVMLLLVLWLSGWTVQAAFFQAIVFMFIETLLVMATALLFSTFSSATLSAIMTIGIYIVGHLTSDLKLMAEKGQDPLLMKGMAALYYMLPNLELLNIKGQAAAGIPVSLDFFVAAMLYGGLYTCLLIAGACVILERRSF